MGVNYSTAIYLPNFNQWSRPVTFYPVVSQPTVLSYTNRGIFGTVAIDIVAMDGSDISEQRAILDILEAEYLVLPVQQDRVYIPDDPGGMPSAGWWEINATETNGGGETTLTLRKYTPPRP